MAFKKTGDVSKDYNDVENEEKPNIREVKREEDDEKNGLKSKKVQSDLTKNE